MTKDSDSSNNGQYWYLLEGKQLQGHMFKKKKKKFEFNEFEEIKFSPP